MKETKKKIAIITPYGAEERLDNYAEFVLAQSLIEKGWDVRMYTYASRGMPTYDRDFVYKTVPIFRCRERLAISPKLFFSLLLFRPQTVFCFHPRSLLNFCAYFAARIIGARYLVEIVGLLHDPYVVNDVDDPVGNLQDPVAVITRFSQFFKKSMSGRIADNWKNYILHMPTACADEIVSINKDEQKYIRLVYGRDSALVYWCTPKNRSTLEEKPKLKDDHPLPDQFLFFIGQLKRRKGWDTALEALASLKQKGITKQLVFVAPPGSDISPAATYATKLGVFPQITFLIGVSNEEKNWLYKNCQYVLIPSRYEGFGLPVFEAFLAGRPICATDIDVFLEFLEHKKNAMISKMGSGEGLALSVEELDKNPELVKTLISGGIKTADDFSDLRMVDGLMGVILGRK